MQEVVLITFGTTLTLIQCLRKWGFFDWYNAHYGHIRFLPDGQCMLCFGFWLSFIICPLYLLAAYLGIRLLFVPFACAGVINFIITFLNTLSSDRTSDRW